MKGFGMIYDMQKKNGKNLIPQRYCENNSYKQYLDPNFSTNNLNTQNYDIKR